MGLFNRLFGKKEKLEDEIKKNNTIEEVTIQEKAEENVTSEEINEWKEVKEVENIDKKSEEIELKKVNISERLTKSKEGFFAKLKNIFTAKSKISDDIYEELEDLLIQSDIGLNMTTKIIAKLEKEVRNRKISETSEVYNLLKDLMAQFLIAENNQLTIKDNELNVILIVGVNGVGKTTTIGKLASKYKKMGKKVLLGAGDTFRAAAVEQLEEWAKRADVEIVKGKEGIDPASVVFDTLTKAQEIKADIVIIDTAGSVPWDNFAAVFDHTDIFYYDYKTASENDCKNVCGGDKSLILSNLNKLIIKGKNVHVRIPLIPGFNMGETDCENISDDLLSAKVKYVDLLPFHRLGSAKYEALNLEYAYKNTPPSNVDTVTYIKRIYSKYFIVNVE